ncbi:acyltransferase family protein [Phyllobacterium brassicacearum]|uniref:acyltransferase family protein n=1 Tax=Phyllobacterium brassicacearum TaxID=314235 RepID=UPI0010E95FD0|nr:acyltransferase family protein [Phyllobacterium brassicacearum]TDQ25954.1 acyltransferase-like protein [Phyllobacterium brassicacearum]
MINVIFALWLVNWRSRSLVLLAAVSGLAMVTVVSHEQSLNVGWNWSTLYAGFVRVTFAFTIGILLARDSATPRQTVSWAALVPIILLILAFGIPVPQQYRTMFDLAIGLFICPTILYYGIVFECPQQIRPLASFLGDISYPVYAIHFPLLFMFNHVA